LGKVGKKAQKKGRETLGAKASEEDETRREAKKNTLVRGPKPA